MADAAASRSRAAVAGGPAFSLCGAVVAAAALAPPLHVAADRDLAMHMVQHVLLLTVAPPLLVLGSGLRPPPRRALIPIVIAHTAVLWGWHLPVLYDATQRSGLVHGFEHLSMLAVGTLLWWAIGIGAGAIDGASILAVFVTAVAGTVLGLGLTLADHTWYAHYPSLVDQQIAGVVMWGVAGGLNALVGGALVAWWVATDTVGRA